MKSVQLYDTTLRDGTQGEGFQLSMLDKLRIAQRLDTFGVDYIEGGWPGSNPKDIEFFQEAKKLDLKHAKLAAFGSTRRADLAVEEDPQVALTRVDTRSRSSQIAAGFAASRDRAICLGCQPVAQPARCPRPCSRGQTTVRTRVY